MLKIITDIADPLMDYIKDDPVRPEITPEARLGRYRFVAALVEDQPLAMVCVSLHDAVPAKVEDLDDRCDDPTVAVFYTIWSYAPGSAAKLLFDTVSMLRNKFPGISRFVTLSPKTEMARKFHLRNGAFILKENDHSINYEYVLLD